MFYYGVSEELIGLFQALRGTPSNIPEYRVSGKTKFDAHSVEIVENAFLSGNYFGLTYRLSYFLLAVSLRDPQPTKTAWMNFFWEEEYLTPKRFRQAFTSLSSDAFTMDDKGLHIKATEEAFCLYPTNVGTLACLLEALVYINPAILEQAEDFFLSPSHKKVQELSNQLQGVIYDYLKEHIDDGRQKERFRHLLNWIRTEIIDSKEGKEITPELITDSAILDFWQTEAINPDDTLGFVLYRTAAENFMDLRMALIISRDMQNTLHADGIGFEEESEWSPDVLEEVLQAAAPPLDVLSLSSTPKFLTASLAKDLAAITNQHQMNCELSFTRLRHKCFGDWQAVLVEAKRKNSGMKTKLAETPADYDAYLKYLSNALEKSQKARDSGLHVLLKYHAREVYGLLMDELDEADRRDIKGKFEEDYNQTIDYEDYPAAEFLEWMMQHWKSLLLQFPELNKIVKRIKKAFSQNERAGFVGLPEFVDTLPYYDGVEMLAKIIELVRTFVDRAEGKTEASLNKADFVSDLSIFKSVYMNIYGGSL